MPKLEYDQPIRVAGGVHSLHRSENHGEAWAWTLTKRWATIVLGLLIVVLAIYGGVKFFSTSSSAVAGPTVTAASFPAPVVNSPVVATSPPATATVVVPSPAPTPTKSIWDLPENR